MVVCKVVQRPPNAALRADGGLCAPQSLDVFMAGDDVDKKKPDPSIYRIAAQRLGVDPGDCLVVEDSTIGLKVSAIGRVHPILKSLANNRARAEYKISRVP